MAATNRLLQMCHQLGMDDDGKDIGSISSTVLSQQRESDVINDDKEEL